MAVDRALHLRLLLNVLGNWGLSPERRLSSARHPPHAWDSGIPSAAQTHAGHTTSGSSAAGETEEICINQAMSWNDFVPVKCLFGFAESHQTWNHGWPMALPTLNLRLTTTCSRLLIRFTAEREKHVNRKNLRYPSKTIKRVTATFYHSDF